MDNVKTLAEITHNGRIKTFPNGEREIMIASKAIFRESGWEARKEVVQTRIIDGSGHESADRARRRARSMVKEYCMANDDLNYFVTLTLSPDVIDRYDIKAIVKSVNVWLDNRVRRNGLKYVLVPELHKDGAIHFHGLVNDCLGLVDSGTLTGGSLKKPRKPKSASERKRLLASGAQTVYNILDWKYGFSTVIELYGERRAAVSYVCKYISKTQNKIGGRWYYSGGKLKRAAVSYFDTEYDISAAAGGSSWVVPELNCEFTLFVEGIGEEHERS